MTWTNEDGLVQRFGVERSTSQTHGVSTRGVKNYLVVDLPDATALVNTLGTSYPPDEDSPFVPAGSIVTNAPLLFCLFYVLIRKKLMTQDNFQPVTVIF